MANPLGINIKLKLDDKELKQNLAGLKNTEVNIDIKNFTEINNNFKTLAGYIDKFKDFKGISPLKGTQLKDIKEVVTLLKEVNELNKGIKINVYSDSKKIIDTEKVKGQLGNEEKVLKEFAKGIGLNLTKELREQIKKAMTDEGSFGDIVKSKLFKEDKDYSKELSKKLIEPYEKAVKYLKEKTFYINPVQFSETQSEEISDSFRGYIKYNKDKEKPSDATYFGKIKKEFMEQYGHLIPSDKDIKTTQDFALALTQVVNKYKDLKKGNVGDSLGLSEEQGNEREAKALADVTSQLDILKDKLNAIKSTKDMLKNVSKVEVETDEIKEQNKEIDKQNEKLKEKVDITQKLIEQENKSNPNNGQRTLLKEETTTSIDKDGTTGGSTVLEKYQINLLETETILSRITEEGKEAFKSIETGDYNKARVQLYKQIEQLLEQEFKLKKEIINSDEQQQEILKKNLDIVTNAKQTTYQKIDNYNLRDTERDNTIQNKESINNNELKIQKENLQYKKTDDILKEIYKIKTKIVKENQDNGTTALLAKELNIQLKQLDIEKEKLSVINKRKIEENESSLKSNLKLTQAKVDDGTWAKIQSAQKSQNKILSDLSKKFKGFYDTKEIEEFRKQLDNLSPTSESLGKDIDKLNNKINKFKNELSDRQKISGLGVDISGLNTGVNIGSSNKDVEKLVKQIGGINTEIKHIDSTPIIENGNEVRKVTYKVKEGTDKWHEYQIAIIKAGDTGQTTLKQADKGLTGFANKQVTFTNRIKNAWVAVASFAGVTSVFYNLVHGFKNGVNSVIELDTAMVGLKKVTDETEETYNNFTTTANKMAIAVGHSTKSAIESTAEFAKLGYSLQESAKLAQEALIYSNIGDIDIADSTKSITATMKGFNLTANDTRHILDALNEVGNNYAISTGGIGDALQRSASALNEANNSFEESVGLITAGNASVQDTEKVGNALKTISMRLRGISEESGEVIPKLREDIKDISKVDIMVDNDTFKSTYQILTDISKVWSDLTDKDRATLMEKIAGKQQGNIFASIMANMKDGISATETALNSMGSASAEQEKYMESIQARMNTFKETAVEFWSNLIDGQTIKNFVDSGTSIIRILDTLFNKTGSVNVGFALIGSALLGLSSKFRDFLGTLVSVKEGQISWNISAKGTKSVLDSLKIAYIEGAVSGGTYGGVISAIKLAFNSLNASALITQLRLMGIKILMTTFVSVIGTLAITALTNFISKLFEAKKPIEELNEAFNTKIQGNNSNIQYLKQISDEYEKLSLKTNLSAEESTKLSEINNTLAEKFPTLVKGYDSQGNAILNLKGNVSDLIAKLEEANRVEALKFLEEGDKDGSFDKSLKKMKKEQEELDDINRKIEIINNGTVIKGGISDGQIIKGIKQYNEELSKTTDPDKARIIQQRIDALTKEGKEASNTAKIKASAMDEEAQKLDNFKNQALMSQSTFASMGETSKNFLKDYVKNLNFSDFDFDKDKMKEHIESVTKALSSSDGTKFINDINKLNKEMSNKTPEEYEKELNDLITGFSKLSGIDSNILSKILKVDPNNIQNLIEAGNAVDKIAEKLEEAKKKFSDAEGSIDFYEKLQKEFEDYGQLSASSIKEIIENHNELIPYLNNEAILRKKLTGLIGEQRKEAVDAYREIIEKSEDYYNVNIKGTNTIETALKKYNIELTDSMKDNLKNAKTLAKARLDVENELTEQMGKLWKDYYTALGTSLEAVNGSDTENYDVMEERMKVMKDQARVDAGGFSGADKEFQALKDMQTKIENAKKAFDSITANFDTSTISGMSNNLEKLKDTTDKAKYSADAYANAMKALQVQMDALNSSMSKLYKNSWDYISALDKKKELIKQQIELTKQEISLNEKLAGGYKGGTSAGSISTVSTKSAGNSIGDQIVNEANKYIGTPYLWGGTTTKGFDCSGLVQYVYKQLNIDINRVSQAQIKNGRAINKSELQKGDLVFFGDPNAPHHVGIYAGNGQYIHAPKTGDVVKYSNLNSRSDFAGARRIVSNPSVPATSNGKVVYQNKTSTKGVSVEEATDRAWNEAQDLKQKLINLQQEYDDIKFEKYTSTIGILDDKIKRTDVNAGIYQTRATKWSGDLEDNFKNFDSYINEIQEKNKVLLEKQKYMQNEIWNGKYNSDQLVNMKFELQDTVAEIENMTKALQDAFQEKWDFKFEFDNRGFEDFDQSIDDYQDKIDLLNESDLNYNSEKSSLLGKQIDSQQKYINSIQKSRVEIMVQRDKLKENSWEWNYLNDKAKEYEEKMDDIAKAIKQQNDELKNTLNNGLDNLKDIESKVIELIKKRYEEEEKLAKESIEKRQKAEEKRHKEQLDNYEEEKKAFEEIIKLQLKDLDKEENQRSYEKDLNKMEEEKAKLQYSYDSLLMNNSFEAEAERVELAEQIAKKQEEIKEFQHKHSLDLRKENLNDQLEAFQKEQDKKIDKENDEYEKFKEKLEKKEKATEEHYKELLKQDNLYSEAKKAIFAGEIEYIDGELMELGDALMKYEDDWAEGMSLLGTKIKSELITNLQKAVDTANNLDSILDKINEIGEVDKTHEVTKGKKVVYAQSDSNTKVNDYLTAKKHLEKLGYKVVDVSKLSKAEQDAIKLKSNDVVLGGALSNKNLNGANRISGDDRYETEEMTKAYASYTEKAMAGDVSDIKNTVYGWGNDLKEAKKWLTAMGYKFVNSKDMTPEELAKALNSGDIVLGGTGVSPISNDLLSQLGAIRLGGNTSQETLDMIMAWARHGGIPRYSKGGLINHTGLAYVDGTSSSPEIAINNADAGSLFNFIKNIPNSIHDMIPNLNSAFNFNNMKSSGLDSMAIPSLNIDNLINVEGNLDKSTMPQLKDITNDVLRELQKVFNKSGFFKKI